MTSMENHSKSPSFNGKRCVICGKTAQNFCSSCKTVYYCSAAHQREDWRKHKQICPPMTITHDPNMGYYYIANRQIKAGSILLDEKPALYSPQWFEDDLTSIPNCLACGLYMEEMSERRCDSCGWPVCSKECAEMRIHADNECKQFRREAIHFPPPISISPHDLCLSILLLRGIGLKCNNGKSYQQLMTLQQSHLDKAANDKLNLNANTIVEQFYSLVGQKVDSPKEEVLKLARIRKINSFASHLDPATVDIGKATGSFQIFLQVSRFNHSCLPNCTSSIVSLPHLQIRIRASIDIAKGTPLTINYRLPENRLGTIGRQLILQEQFGFTCHCERCLDPTELNSFSSAVKCLVCTTDNETSTGFERQFQSLLISKSDNGYLLPIDPLHMEPNAVWKCNSCTKTICLREIQNRLENMMENWENLKTVMTVNVKNAIYSRLKEIRNSVGQYKKFLIEYANKLHSNHWLVQKGINQILECQLQIMDLLRLEECKENLQYYEHILKIRDKLEPGISIERARLLRNMAVLLLTTLVRFKEQLTRKEIQKMAGRCQEILLESLEFFKEDVTTKNFKISIADRIHKEIQILEDNFCNLF